VFSTAGLEELAPSAQANMSAAMINSPRLRIADCGLRIENILLLIADYSIAD
jgi:hypothetical protein